MEDEIYLSTGIDSLDSLLSPDRYMEHPSTNGFLLHVKGHRLFETPVILIEGSSSVDKSILALQVAFHVKSNDGCPWEVYYYSLKQSKLALENIAINLGLMKKDKSRFKDLSDPKTSPAGEPPHVNLCHLSPHPPEENENSFVFEQRKRELQHAIKQVCNSRYNPEGSENYHPLFILDSLTAFADRSLIRNELHQLFELFRMNNVPVIMTIEKYNHFISEQDTISQESARLLADVVIERKGDVNLDKKKVFVVHGRNEKIRRSMFEFLRSIGLNPIEWDEAKMMTGKPIPYIGEVLDAVFTNAQAVIVLITPDDEAKLRDEFIQASDKDYEKNLTPQARPNVMYEAGMAMGRCPNRTIIVEFGNNLRPYSDIGGLNVIRMTDSVAKRSSLIAVIKTTGADIEDLTGKTDWMNTGDFNI